MFAIFIISLIISTALAVDQTVGQSLANDRSNKITKEATRIYNEIAKDRDLASRLLDAYNKRDAALANQMLMSSPFGNRIQVLKRAYQKNQKDIANTNAKIGDIERENTRVSSLINEKQSKSQTSGSAIGDLISGAAKDPTTEPINYNGTGITSSTIEEVNYGQKR